MRNVCIFLLMVCSLYACEEGCGNKEVNADLTISFPPSVNTPILEYIDTVKYLKLEDKDEALLAYVKWFAGKIRSIWGIFPITK